MDDQTQAALRLLAELQNATQVDTQAIPDQTPAARITIRTPDGEYIGEALLSTRATNEIANVVSCAAAYPLTKTRTPIEAYLEAEIDEHCIGLDTDYLMAMAATDPRQAVAAFDKITADEDGQL